MHRSSRGGGATVAFVAATALLLAGLYALAASISNNPLEGWGMLLRALAGHAMLLGAWECALRGGDRAPSRRARALGAFALSLLLTPAALFVLLLTRESGESWSVAALILLVWFAASGGAALVVARRG